MGSYTSTQEALYTNSKKKDKMKLIETMYPFPLLTQLSPDMMGS